MQIIYPDPEVINANNYDFFKTSNEDSEIDMTVNDAVTEKFIDPLKLISCRSDKTIAEEVNQQAIIQRQKMETMGQLTVSIAHQMKTPLSIISSRLQLLKNDIDDKQICESKQKVEKLLMDTEKLSKMIDSFLRFSKKSEETKYKTDINDIIKRILAYIRVNACEKGILIKEDLDINLPKIFADDCLLEQAFLNIILNAFDAMPDGGILILRSHLVILDGRPYVSVSFKDNGEGMSPEVRKNILNPFFSKKVENTATGMGLFISHQIVREHQGKISSESVKGEGSNLSIMLPSMNITKRNIVAEPIRNRAI